MAPTCMPDRDALDLRVAPVGGHLAAGRGAGAGAGDKAGGPIQRRAEPPLCIQHPLETTARFSRDLERRRRPTATIWL